MMRVWPALESRLQSGLLVVTGVVRPTRITREYRIRLTYRDYGAPKVYVVSPKLERRPQEPEIPIPHTYEFATPGNEHPCVYYSKSREWTPHMLLATSIMPWLLSWLLDYEFWYATGEWLGGGMPHGSTKSADDPPRDEEAA
jgi:hypothetical protein